MLTKQLAYEKWLGIQAHEQPPTLYRLLGVNAFETDPDAISYAADGRMALLRQFQISENAKLAEEILGEISRARVVLLNADQKAAYDQRLREQVAAKTAKASAAKLLVAAPLPNPSTAVGTPIAESATTPGFDLDSLTIEPALKNTKRSSRPKTKNDSLIWGVAGCGVALASIVIWVAVSYSGGDGPSSQDSSGPIARQIERPKSPLRPMDNSPLGMPAQSNSRGKPPRELPMPKSSGAPAADPMVSGPLVPKESLTSDSGAPTAVVPSQSAATSVAPNVSPANASEKKPERSPVPDAKAQAGAAKLVQEVYGREIAAAKTADEKKALAEKLLQSGKQAEQDRASQFMLFKLSRDIAAQGAICETAFQAIEETSKEFQIDALALKAEALRKCGSAATGIDQHLEFANRAAILCDEAFVADKFFVATQLNEFTLSEARKAKDETLIKRSTERRDEIEKAQHLFENAKQALASLEKNASDPEANLIVGKYKCFIKGDWPTGLRMLTLGSDPNLKALADDEIKGAASAQEQAALGDAWWTWAESQKDSERKPILARASFWYQKALPGLTGLAKDKADSRLRKLQAGLPVYLTDLPASEGQMFGGVVRADATSMLQGKVSTHTLWAHPPTPASSAHISYRLDSGFKTLSGVAGVGGTNQASESPLTFRVVGDGNTLWSSRPLQNGGESVKFRVNVKDVNKLELFVDCPGSHNLAWAIWIDPYLER